MAYRCPVCDTPQVDAEHLANHLAFTAVIHGDDHERWLDEHVADWNDQNPETLAPTVAEAVPEVDVPELEDDGEHEHDHGGRLEDELARQGGHRGRNAAAGRGDLTDEAASVVEQARELTERKYDVVETEDPDAAADESDDSNADSGDAADSDEASENAEDGPESESK